MIPELPRERHLCARFVIFSQCDELCEADFLIIHTAESEFQFAISDAFPTSKFFWSAFENFSKSKNNCVEFSGEEYPVL